MNMHALKSPNTQTKDIQQEAEITSSRIHDLITTLENNNGEESAGMLRSLKATMDGLMEGYFEQHSDLESEINGVLESLRHGQINQVYIFIIPIKFVFCIV